MYKEQDFEDIRPYHDEEINPAIRRLISVPEFGKVLDFLYPGKDKSLITAGLSEIHNAVDFQIRFMHPLVNSIVNKTSKGLTCSGFEYLTPGNPYLFVANHRDIVLDSAMLQVLLLDNGHLTSEITFGSNLMTNQFIIDFGKINRMFVVYRGGNRMELFRNAQLLSAYIRHTITAKHTSAWIAQRNGRTKDGNDKTEPGLLKMFSFSGGCDFIESFRELNIVPLAVSYEYEPCCAFKVREMAAVAKGLVYQKAPQEDLMSIINGITQEKGHIHLAVCKPVNHYLQEVEAIEGNNEKINRLSSLMDAEIHRNYTLWPSNYIACDLLHGDDRFSVHYTPDEKEGFFGYMQKELSIFKEEPSQHREILLRIYATPVINSGKLV
jgi:hypothetical protein